MWQKLLCTVVLTFVCAIPGAPQGALVVPLSNEETAHARELYQRMVAAEAEWNKYKIDIRDKYAPTLANQVPESKRIKVSPSNVLMPVEWFNGIEFTTDFRFAVPKRDNK